MNTQEAAALLAVAAAFDNRKPDADAAQAWAVVLDGLRFEDCRDAIVAHYRTSSDWLMPQKVIAEVKRIRSKRIAEYGPIPIPADHDPDDVMGHRRWLKEARRAIADGNPLPVAAIAQSVPMPPELAAQIERFGQLPADVETQRSTTHE